MLYTHFFRCFRLFFINKRMFTSWHTTANQSTYMFSWRIWICKNNHTSCLLSLSNSLNRFLVDLVSTRFNRVTIKKRLQRVCIIFSFNDNNFFNMLLHLSPPHVLM